MEAYESVIDMTVSLVIAAPAMVQDIAGLHYTCGFPRLLEWPAVVRPRPPLLGTPRNVMPKLLDPEQLAAFRRDGFVAPVCALSPGETAAYRQRFEDYERARIMQLRQKILYDGVEGKPAHVDG
jgi:hypothetical protein